MEAPLRFAKLTKQLKRGYNIKHKVLTFSW